MARRDQRSDGALAYRHLYRTARWKRTRADQLQREPLCRMCSEQGRVTAATVCDHRDNEAKKDPARFFDGPFDSLCAPHHDSTKQREEKRGHVIGSDESGAPLDPRHPWNKG